ncbi:MULTISPECIES: flavin reductase family protein [unclassified Paraburkholderia]|uniref:flavin reductase family protein n=1 Tax=unclassified Paraburkholderia TaxID=2615204 RepID=UPI001840A25F|nr:MULTISPECIES: flavin reductase family protein [unclassified Paraburkholderia]MBB5445486.1 flavin reductase (NADH)/flavin reductase [Paraburkholderia sp. WSM4177]MBB5486034.1 flavin reductase (NADH)/flavin reductase [Paraburkholderia sp. WSM4180]
MSIEESEFKRAMRCLTGHVCLITTGSDAVGPLAGMTATAVTSVSAAPPILLICINRANSSLAHVQATGNFVVNVLARSEQELAQRFSRPISPQEKFQAGTWNRIKTGAPALASAMVNFDCSVERIIEIGTHAVIFGHVEGTAINGQTTAPLLYSQGSYGEFQTNKAIDFHDLLWISNWGAD